MSGTIVISPSKSIDVRTVDFLRLIEVLRSMKGRSPIVPKLLESVDELGMNMICVDELDSAELGEFDRLVKEIGYSLPGDGAGLAEYLDDVHSLIILDNRFIVPDGGTRR
jgi:hypothetical protein